MSCKEDCFIMRSCGVQYGEGRPPCASDVVAQNSTSDNSVIVQLLCDCRDVLHQLRPNDFDFYKENNAMFCDVIDRLNVVLAQQH
jgi:hypothetical protein